MARPSFITPIPDYFMPESFAHLDSITLATAGSHVGNVRDFLDLRGRYAHYFFNRVKVWDIAINLQSVCPNTADGEFETVTIGMTWDREDKGMADELDLRGFRDLASVNDGDGIDLVTIDGPSNIIVALNELNQYTTGGGLIYTNRADFSIFLGAYAYPHDIGSPAAHPNEDNFTVGVMFDVRVQGNAWATPDAFSIDPIPVFDAVCNNPSTHAHRFVGEGSTTSDFRIRGNFLNAAGSGSYSAQPIGDFGADFQFIMTPNTWWPFTNGLGVPRFDTATGEPI